MPICLQIIIRMGFRLRVKFSFAVFQPIFVKSMILLAIYKIKYSFSLEFVLPELSIIIIFIREYQLAFSLKFIKTQLLSYYITLINSFFVRKYNPRIYILHTIFKSHFVNFYNIYFIMMMQFAFSKETLLKSCVFKYYLLRLFVGNIILIIYDKFGLCIVS